MTANGQVLVIDDEPTIRETVALALGSEDIPVQVAGDGAEALRILRDGYRPDVILLDLMMPGMNGWEFRREQQADPAIADIPVVVFSGAGEADLHARQMGAHASLSKPVTLEMLVGTVRRFFRRGDEVAVPPP